ncbi:MAG: hypothetical protein DWC11_05580 [Candidatus Poseidoniales archaeon]|nr:MAG: hypothetical protein DWC11_05580 [Candidatus Poseidoniales archaeon]
MAMNTVQIQDLVAEVEAVMHGIPEEDRIITDQRYDAEQTGLNLLESVLTNSKRWRVNGTGVTMDHPAGVQLDVDVMGSMLMAVQEDEQHLVMSVDGQPICVAGEGIFYDVPMSDHLTTVVLLGEAGFPISHTPDTLYMLHSPADLLANMSNEFCSLQERISAAKLLVPYVNEEEGEGSISTQSFNLAETGNLPPQVELELVYSELYPRFMPLHEASGNTMVNKFVDLVLRLTRHRPEKPSHALHRFIDVHVQRMRHKDQERVRDLLLALCETSRPELHALFETADGIYQNGWDFDRFHEMHQEIIHVPPHLRMEHLGIPADAYENVHDVDDIMMF